MLGIDDRGLRDVLARLHVAAWSGRLPRDLGDCLIDIIGTMESRTQRRRERDVWLRRAASRFSGSAWVRAGIVRAELLVQAAERDAPCRDPDSDWRGCVAAARAADPRIPSRKQLARILDAAEPPPTSR
ncbi:MAG: hypothetical protein IPH76_16875 [Xanthomonadales bacterium]|nr:hypothetical protein [Xanthomonadales bacterium]